MMSEGKGNSKTVCLAAAALILVCYLVQTTECDRVMKAERRKETKAIGFIGVQEGKIVFGRAFVRGSGFVSQVTDESRLNSSVKDDATYQADSTGWSKGQTHDVNSKEAWRHMKPSLQCGGDQLKFRVVGPGASQFALEQENAPPIPLSQVPSSCGYSMQKNSLALVLLVPYDGCNMVQEGENYVLPMLWQGNPVSLLCQKPMAHYLSTAAPSTPAKKPEEPKRPLLPAFYPPMFPYFQPPLPFTAEAPVTKAATSTAPPATTVAAGEAAPVTETAAQTTTKLTVPVKKPEMPTFSQFPVLYPHMFPYFQTPPPAATAPATTPTPFTVQTTTKPKPTDPVKKPELPVFPNLPVFYPPMFPYFQPPPPAATVAPLTETVATTTKEGATVMKPEMPVHPNFPYFYPPMFPYFQPPPPVAPAVTAAPAATEVPSATGSPVSEMVTTIKPTAPMKMPEFPNFPYFYPPVFPYFQPPPAATAPTATAPAATTAEASPAVPTAIILATTVAPVTETDAPTTNVKKPEFPKFPVFYPPMFPYFKPPPPAAIAPAATAAPITGTTAQTTTKLAAAVKKPEMPVFPNVPVFYPPMFPYFQPLPPAATEVPTTTAEPTTKSATTITTSAKPSETDPLQMFPFPFPPYIPQYPWPFPESLPAMSKLESPAFPPHMAALGHYPPYMFPPHALSAYTQHPPLKPEPTMPTANPEKSDLPLAPSDPNPQGHVSTEFFPFGNPFGASPF